VKEALFFWLSSLLLGLRIIENRRK